MVIRFDKKSERRGEGTRGNLPFSIAGHHP